jgi:hypothetical protein
MALGLVQGELRVVGNGYKLNELLVRYLISNTMLVLDYNLHDH